MSRITELFAAAMKAAGYECEDPIVADGKIHYFTAKDGGHKSDCCRYFLHSNPPANGKFGCWRYHDNGLGEQWIDEENGLSESDWAHVNQCWKQAEAAEAERLKKQHDKAARKAVCIFNRSNPVGDHVYLRIRGVRGHRDLRENGGRVVVPLINMAGELRSLQFIPPDGVEKKYLSGAEKKGTCFVLANDGVDDLVLCEGYATADSIHQAVGCSVVAAMDCQNLLPVARGLREKYPARKIIVACDNDQFKERNSGLIKGTQAASAIGAWLAIPQFRFEDLSVEPTDFNDVMSLYGLEEVKCQIESAVYCEGEQ